MTPIHAVHCVEARKIGFEMEKRKTVQYLWALDLNFVLLQGLPFIFRNLTTLVLQSANWQLYRKA